MNTQVLEDPQFAEELPQILEIHRTNKLFYSNSESWDHLKLNIKKLSIKIANKMNKQKTTEIGKLENELLNFREKSEKNPENEEYLNRLQDTENELKSKYKTREEGEKIRSKSEKFENNEKPTKYFFRQERKRGEAKQINILVDGNNRTINTKDEIMKEIKLFYAQLYKTETTNIQQITENLKYINQSLSTEDRDKLNKFISCIEIEEAIKGMKNEKSPGDDGIPKEFDHKFFHLLKDELTELYNNIKFEKIMPDSQKNATVKLLFKKGDHRSLRNWRPISLLNTDYKILSKILTNRISNVLDKIVPIEQKCGIKGRKMTDVIRNLASYRDHSMNGFFVLIDQAKAFDRINHEYLFMTMEALGFKGDFLELTRMLYKDITSQVMVNGHPTSKINIERGVRQGCPFSMTLFVLSTIPLINIIKADKRITGHIIKHVHPVKIQSYADDTTIIINQQNEIKYIYEIFNKHSQPSEAAINMEKTQIFRLGDRHVSTKSEHDNFTKKVKDKVTILGAVFCRDKHLETFENLQKAYNALKKAKNNYSYGNFVSLVGKILRLNVFSTVWNNAWLIDIKDKYFKQFLKEVEKYLCKYKGQEIVEKVSKTKDEGGLGLINLTERLQAIKILELLNAASQRPESDNIIYEIGIKQMAFYGANYVGSKAEETNDIIKLLEENIDEINKFRIRHKTTKPKDIQKIIFPMDKKTYFTEIYDAIESKLISTNYLMLHGLLSFRNNRSCYICGKSILIKQVIVYRSVCLSVRLWAAKPQGLRG